MTRVSCNFARLVVAILPFFSFDFLAAAAKPVKPKAEEDIRSLIGKLADIADSDYGYSATSTGTIFLPLDREGQFATGLLFQRPNVRSDTMRRIVQQGAKAVPELIAHLDDRRPTKIKVKHRGGMGGLFFREVYDYNGRTRKTSPLEKPKTKEKDDAHNSFGRRISSHTITVGDLCFVALGQIVNRDFTVMWYQPTAIIYVCPPSLSPALRAAAKKEWSDLTPEKHRASLVKDFLERDHEYRRIEAAKRLAYYYPAALEAPALKVLAEPVYDAADLRDFVAEKLYKAKDSKEAQRLFDAYLARHGAPARQGILAQLFGDLERLENEEARTNLEGYWFKDKPRQMLIQLYGKRKDVKSRDRPPFEPFMSSFERSGLIEGGLIHDEHVKIDQAIRELLRRTTDDDLALACMKRITGRGYDEDIERYCRRRLPLADKYRKPGLEEMLGKLGWTRLHVAVERGDAAKAQSLLESGADAKARARDGRAALHVAASSGNTEIVKLLLAARADLNPTDGAGLTPVQLAVRQEHLDTVQALAAAGCALPDVLSAASAGRADLVEKFLKKDANLVTAATENKRSLLHLAARQGHATVAEVLLRSKAAVNAEDKDGWQPLHHAIAAGHESVVRILLAHKADARAPLKDEGNLQPLHMAAHDGREKIMAMLLAAKVNVNCRTDSLETPLHLAAAAKQARAAAILVATGATVDAKDKGDNTPLHAAAHSGALEVVQLLIKHKAKINARGQAGYTPLHFAAEAGDRDVVQLLFAHGADASLKTRFWDKTALDLARDEEHTEIVKLLQKNK